MAIGTMVAGKKKTAPGGGGGGFSYSDFGGGGGGGERAYAVSRGGSPPARAGSPGGGASAPPATTGSNPYPGFNNPFSTPATGITEGPFVGANPPASLGNPYGITQPYGPFVRTNEHDPVGGGAYGLPDAFSNWQSAARYSLVPALQFQTDSQSVVDQLGKDTTKDYQGDLYGISSDAAEAQFSDSRRKMEQGLAQAGYGGGGTVSPFAAQQLQLEGQARAGVLGNAARQSVLQAQQMKAEASRSYLNALSTRMQAMLTPAMLQSAGVTKTPTGNVGPSVIGPALQLGSSVLGALT